MQARRSFVLPASKQYFARGLEFHTRHTRIALKVDIEKKTATGSCRLTVVPVGGQRRELHLDAKRMEISRVTVDGSQARFEYDGERLTVEAEQPLEGEHEVEVWYTISHRNGLFFIGPDDARPNKPYQAWTHSEAEFARYWFPCRDFPNDRGTSETLITVPAGNTVVSNGILVSKEEKGGWVTFHWREETPHPTYLTSFAAGKFGEIADEAEGVQLNYFFPEEKRKDALRYFGETPKMIKTFHEVTGVKYPYPKYAQTAVEDFTVGGMENISATTLATTYFPDERSEEDFQVSYAQAANPVSLVAHELAHQWFGDLVTCVDWSHAWLNEGWATYMQALYLERTRGADEFRHNMSLKAAEVFEEDETRYRRPIVFNWYIHPDDLFDRALYEKASWMLHELRYLMGDELFFSGVKGYLTKFAVSNADTHDFRRSMEAASGISLQEFFEQAFFKGGFPEFQLSYEWNEPAKAARVRVQQVQQTDEMTPVFRLPCALVFYTERGRVEKRVKLDSKDQTFEFELDSRPEIVEFDPEEWLLKKVKFPKSSDLLLKQLEGSRDASSRALAAAELASAGSKSVVEALARAARNDGFWAVRARALKSLGEMETDDALAALLELGLPEQRRVRRALVEALGHYKSEKARSVAEGLLLNDKSPYVQCEAALALAKMGAKSAPDLLKQAMQIPSPNSTLTEACLEAMGKLKDDSLKATIWENAKYGKPMRVRLGALKAVKARGRIDETEFGALVDLLTKDKEFRVRLFVVNDLIPALMDRRFAETLREAAEADEDDRVSRRAWEVLRDLASTAPPALEDLKVEVEKLKEENRKLRDSLQTVRASSG